MVTLKTVFRTMRYLLVVATTHLPSKVTSTDVIGAPNVEMAVLARVRLLSLYKRIWPSSDPMTMYPSPAGDNPFP